MKKITPAGLSALAKGDLKNFLLASRPGGIEAQEAQGQKDFVNSETLPKEMLHGCTQEKLEAMGIQFGKKVDDLFVNVILPEGWTKQPTEHSMWSELKDDKGRVRGNIFYKAAFYDRSAHISLARRFLANYMPEDDYESKMSYEDRQAGKWYGVVKDKNEGDKVVFRTASVINPSYEKQEALREEARVWLFRHYPDWENELAYWDG